MEHRLWTQMAQLKILLTSYVALKSYVTSLCFICFCKSGISHTL